MGPVGQISWIHHFNGWFLRDHSGERLPWEGAAKSGFAAIHSSLDLQNLGFLDLMKIPFVQVGCAVHNSPANPIFGAKKTKNPSCLYKSCILLLTPFSFRNKKTQRKNHITSLPRYDAFRVGEGGGGGEYVPQTGFGWSNGVAMVLRLGVEGNGDAITMV